jgi:hypothetical protein
VLSTIKTHFGWCRLTPASPSTTSDETKRIEI